MQLTQEIKKFILEHQDEDPLKLLLKKEAYPDIPMQFAVEQILGRKKAKTKLPTWVENEGIIYPAKLSMEQCSSEQTAKYKADLVVGKSLLDMTGGFGVDTAFFAEKFEKVVYVERNEALFEVAKQNFNTLGLAHVGGVCGNAVDYLQQNKEQFDVIYLDPARRDEHAQKVFQLEDCEPNLLEIKSLLLSKSKEVLVKLSPMLDIKKAVQALFPSEIHVLAVDNECKEVLCKLDQTKVVNPKLVAVNLKKNGKMDLFEGYLDDERAYSPVFSEPLQYIYEPNVALLKAGFFNSVAKKYQLNKLHPHTHIYASEQLINEFPGRIFVFEKSIGLNKKVLSREISGKKANITVRNYPMSVQQIRQKTGLGEGGDVYLFAVTTLGNEKLILKCRKI
ncbi:RsmD family RNA methyltransferase [Flammeovirgaceae bacterium SG7u.111]|nr:RsmD family RNA methyltransferase [Flammeovirgaceae bacterium SG7u.132]WPO37047.1 RsmD family RNA methyltransferase [Flammeovirgaceae bacterium SG7u.111]